MTIAGFKGVIADGGGYENIVQLIFDNAIHCDFSPSSPEKQCLEADFVELGGEEFYKETIDFRSYDTGEYDVPLVVYHPMDCLQGVIMGDDSRLDVMARNDML